MKIKPIILSGGSGTRLWPLSTENKPKQFFDIFDKNNNLFEETLNRITNLNFEKPIIISNKNQRFNILKSIRKNNYKYDKIILEDKPKNTAPAFAASTLFCKNEEILCFLPSDHYIQNNKKFITTLLKAYKVAMSDQLVILGLESTEPNINYGYIKYNNKSIYKDCFEVDSFIEKPERSKAIQLYKNNALWNSGIVIIKNSYLKFLFNKYFKKNFLLVKNSFDNSYKNMEFTFLGQKDWNKIPVISFDYAILEKTFKKMVIPLAINWNDLGTFESIHDIKESIGQVERINTKNCFTFSNNNLLVTNDVKDLNIINTKEITLVTKKGDSNAIKKVLKKIKLKRKKENFNQSDSNRPWGSFSNLGQGDGYKVKKLHILPGQKISLQKHFKRSEHWVVVQGTAFIIKGKKQFKLNANQSTFIKKGETHRIENKSKKDLIMIEIQTGAYLEEDDIKRFKDIYNR
ncbi:MAG: mannose-1-phosphate guanylyltransferase/mannose-6-phosphate isomerase [Pelagibacterales bacterium]|nr:mannose-1-phosphate guanylyltransferase/mannose-6-phosphate isomerase [Pelagibacterales bacterium]OUU63237.1 MAG: mannose-1-phosphate guanylyltransferase/mannose-6-phosphate isomerase [Alphaproteobacteria bacterium TMED62]|tara:strand:+ start:7656 stop:9035 length:1380 start_codon:yes stop_codon:yes gene_type:complete